MLSHIKTAMPVQFYNLKVKSAVNIIYTQQRRVLQYINHTLLRLWVEQLFVEFFMLYWLAYNLNNRLLGLTAKFLTFVNMYLWIVISYVGCSIDYVRKFDCQLGH